MLPITVIHSLFICYSFFLKRNLLGLALVMGHEYHWKLSQWLVVIQNNAMYPSVLMHLTLYYNYIRKSLSVWLCGFVCKCIKSTKSLKDFHLNNSCQDKLSRIRISYLTGDSSFFRVCQIDYGPKCYAYNIAAYYLNNINIIIILLLILYYFFQHKNTLREKM